MKLGRQDKPGCPLCGSDATVELLHRPAVPVASVIDVNPAKQGKYVAGTGHRIVGPTRLAREDVATLLVLNPNYSHATAAALRRLGSQAVAVDATDMVRRSACA